MKRNSLICLALASMCYLSCKKEDNRHQPENNRNEKIPVSFNVKDFIQHTESLNNSGARIAKANNLRGDSSISRLTDIYYFALTADSRQLASIKHSNVLTDTLFGEIKDTLYKGEYDIYMLASDTALWVSQTNGLETIVRLDAYTIPQSSDHIPFKDIFYKVTRLNLAKGISTQSVTLNRAVGNLQVEVLDANTNADYNISAVVTGEYTMIDLRSFTKIAEPFPFLYDITLRPVSSTVLSSNIANTVEPLTLTITATNKKNGQQIQKVISNVRCYKNKRTTVTGSLNIPGSNGAKKEFQITVNDTWNPDTNHIEF